MRRNRIFASGGSTALGSAPTGPSLDPQLVETNRPLRILASKPDGWNYASLERYQDQIEDTRLRASA